MASHIALSFSTRYYWAPSAMELRQPLGCGAARATRSRVQREDRLRCVRLSASVRTVNGVVEPSYSRRVTADFVIRWDRREASTARGSRPQSTTRVRRARLPPSRALGITSLADERGRPDVRNAIPSQLLATRLAEIMGRLDRHQLRTAALDDGWAPREPADPVRSVPRKYEAVVAGSVRSPEALRAPPRPACMPPLR